MADQEKAKVAALNEVAKQLGQLVREVRTLNTQIKKTRNQNLISEQKEEND